MSNVEEYSMKHYVKQFVKDLRQVSGCLQVPWFHPPLKLITDNISIVAISFIRGGNPEYPEKTSDLSQVTHENKWKN